MRNLAVCLAASVLVVPLASAVPITITLVADPPGPVYNPGESIEVTGYLSAPTVIPQIGLVNIDFSNSGPSVIDYASAHCLAPFDGVFPPPGGPVLPCSGSGPVTIMPTLTPFANFTAHLSPIPGATTVIDVLGPSDPGDATGAFIVTDDFSIIWDNGAPGAEQILGGILAMTTVPEPLAVWLPALALTVALRRRDARRSGGGWPAAAGCVRASQRVRARATNGGTRR